MMNYRSVITGAAALLLTASAAFAQSAVPSPAPSSGGGSTTKPPAAGQPSKDENLDLPMQPPVYTPPAQPSPSPSPPPPPTPDPVDNPTDPTPDPSDEPPPTIYGEEINSENDTIFYVLDISCSMDWDNQSYTAADGQRRNGPRIDRAKAELTRSVMGLSDNFSFNIIAFDCSTRQWSQGMREANDTNKQDAIRWVARLQPTGATGTGPATAQALGDKENMSVVLLTDGAPNCGADGLNGHRRMIRVANTQGAVINVFGIAASGSYRSFCQGVASDSGGSYFDVP